MRINLCYRLAIPITKQYNAFFLSALTPQYVSTTLL